MQNETLQSQIDQLPEKTGVYILKGANSTIYVGKAANIKKRVKNHFQSADKNRRERMITELTEKIDYIITDTETEALIEENILIKTYKPRYNVQLSDDKTYPYLKINLAEDYPRLSISRRMKDDNAKYFGPYSDVGAMRNSIKSIRRAFPIRTCKKDLKKFNDRSCLYYHIGQCNAPCASKISKIDYNKIVKRLILFLEGRRDEVIRNLRSEMRDASINQEYEKAAILRNQISDLEKIMQKVRVILQSKENLDAIVLLRGDGSVCVQVLQIREGKILSSESFDLREANATEDLEVLESFLKQYYSKRMYLPDEMIINKRIHDQSIADWLSKRSNKKIMIKRPLENESKEILNIAEINAQAYLDQIKEAKEKATKSVFELKKDLKLDNAPEVIECFDISNLGVKEAVGSKIVFLNGVPHKKEYRMYKIRTISNQDDQAMIGEIVRRRFNRLVKDGGRYPDLVMVDGGIAQVRAAKKQLDDLSIEIPIIGLAKKWEHIYLPNGKIIELDESSMSSLLLQQIRDEAHRFAIRYHRKRREIAQKS